MLSSETWAGTSGVVTPMLDKLREREIVSLEGFKIFLLDGILW